MAEVEFTPDAEADVRSLVLNPQQRVQLVTSVIHNLSFMPSRFSACSNAGPNARRYHEGPYLVVYDVIGSPAKETVWVLNVLPARGLAASRAIS